MMIPAMWIMLGVLAVLAVAYRYYSAFLATRVVGLDDRNVTPAHTKYDGQNYHPTNRWVLFGHHFAAISGAGPLIGPVLAIQFGYLPGLIWLVIGVCLAGAVQDFLVLVLSTRRDGLSLAGIAGREIGPVASTATAIAILYVIVIALAGLGIVVVKALGGEEVAMPAQSRLVLAPDAAIADAGPGAGGTRQFAVPPGCDYRFDPKDETQSVRINEGFTLSVPEGAAPTVTASDGRTVVTLPAKAKRLVPGSSWGTFTIACTIPIALFVGLYMYRIRKGKVVEASLIGALGVLGATVLGASIPGSPVERFFSLSGTQTTYAIAAYGFIASILPVWLLLCPRDYLSSFLKIGTIALLVVGVILANPTLRAPAINPVFAGGGGPYFRGAIFPYVFICIMCGAISGFHALVSSGTTPKMVDRETDCRAIGYGAMLIEGLVGVVALIAAASLPSSMYYDINVALDQRPAFQKKLDPLLAHEEHGPAPTLAEVEEQVGESLHGRTGGAVTLAVGMSSILTEALPALKGRFRDQLIAFWYHFAIMFEALFILTTIDTGTRIGRFMLQEFLGRLWKPLGNLDWLPGSILATFLITAAWAYFILTNSVATIWPMFGMANQLLALIALTIATTALFNAGKGRYAWVTLAPAVFVASTTFTAAYKEITETYYAGWVVRDRDYLKGWLNIGLTCLLLACVVIIVATAAKRWRGRARESNVEAATTM
jgi:carbon starvation protein